MINFTIIIIVVVVMMYSFKMNQVWDFWERARFFFRWIWIIAHTSPWKGHDCSLICLYSVLFYFFHLVFVLVTYVHTHFREDECLERHLNQDFHLHLLSIYRFIDGLIQQLTASKNNHEMFSSVTEVWWVSGGFKSWTSPSLYHFPHI